VTRSCGAAGVAVTQFKQYNKEHTHLNLHEFNEEYLNTRTPTTENNRSIGDKSDHNVDGFESRLSSIK
tara:strand:- start:9909 stop:10112 length:204 start_codon:yes stop_codon:yes gene_type:complete